MPNKKRESKSDLKNILIFLAAAIVGALFGFTGNLAASYYWKFFGCDANLNNCQWAPWGFIVLIVIMYFLLRFIGKKLE